MDRNALARRAASHYIKARRWFVSSLVVGHRWSLSSLVIVVVVVVVDGGAKLKLVSSSFFQFRLRSFEK